MFTCSPGILSSTQNVLQYFLKCVLKCAGKLLTSSLMGSASADCPPRSSSTLLIIWLQKSILNSVSADVRLNSCTSTCASFKFSVLLRIFSLHKNRIFILCSPFWKVGLILSIQELVSPPSFTQVFVLMLHIWKNPSYKSDCYEEDTIYQQKLPILQKLIQKEHGIWSPTCHQGHLDRDLV